MQALMNELTLIPFPFSAEAAEPDVFFLNGEKKICCTEKEFLRFAESLCRQTAYFDMTCVMGGAPGEKNVISLEKESGAPAESWKMRISPNSIVIRAADGAGAMYACDALMQLISAASECGPRHASIPSVKIEDRPRFLWRGFMLDSARHFQPVSTILAELDLLAHYRINKFHWHITDSDGWRIGCGIVGRDASRDNYNSGCYSRKDIETVREFAKARFIEIIPEIDVPGHSGGLLDAHPEFRCDPKVRANEFCLGNPAGLEFIKKVFLELMELFPESKYIHVGGDEAGTGHWEKCPKCQAALKEKGYHSFRQLENNFMLDLTRFIVKNGRTPIVWTTQSTFPSDVIAQTWHDPIEPKNFSDNKNKVVISTHSSVYFDYPATPYEPASNLMVSLPPEGVYQSIPSGWWHEENADLILGSEACLWTEQVPPWRIIEKTQPRIGAFAERVWSRDEDRCWHSFQYRSGRLAASGYDEFLRLSGRGEI